MGLTVGAYYATRENKNHNADVKDVNDEWTMSGLLTTQWVQFQLVTKSSTLTLV